MTTSNKTVPNQKEILDFLVEKDLSTYVRDDREEAFYEIGKEAALVFLKSDKANQKDILKKEAADTLFALVMLAPTAERSNAHASIDGATGAAFKDGLKEGYRNSFFTFGEWVGEQGADPNQVFDPDTYVQKDPSKKQYTKALSEAGSDPEFWDFLMGAIEAGVKSGFTKLVASEGVVYWTNAPKEKDGPNTYEMESKELKDETYRKVAFPTDTEYWQLRQYSKASDYKVIKSGTDALKLGLEVPPQVEGETEFREFWTTASSYFDFSTTEELETKEVLNYRNAKDTWRKVLVHPDYIDLQLQEYMDNNQQVFIVGSQAAMERLLDNPLEFKVEQDFKVKGQPVIEWTTRHTDKKGNKWELFIAGGPRESVLVVDLVNNTKRLKTATQDRQAIAVTKNGKTYRVRYDYKNKKIVFLDMKGEKLKIAYRKKAENKDGVKFPMVARLLAIFEYLVPQMRDIKDIEPLKTKSFSTKSFSPDEVYEVGYDIGQTMKKLPDLKSGVDALKKDDKHEELVTEVNKRFFEEDNEFIKTFKKFFTKGLTEGYKEATKKRIVLWTDAPDKVDYKDNTWTLKTEAFDNKLLREVSVDPFYIDLQKLAYKEAGHYSAGTLKELREKLGLIQPEEGHSGMAIEINGANVTEWVHTWETDDYPYGRKRTSARWFVETKHQKKKSIQRVGRTTKNPNTGRDNAPKYTNYYDMAGLAVTDEDRAYTVLWSNQGSINIQDGSFRTVKRLSTIRESDIPEMKAIVQNLAALNKTTLSQDSKEKKELSPEQKKKKERQVLSRDLKRVLKQELGGKPVILRTLNPKQPNPSIGVRPKDWGSYFPERVKQIAEEITKKRSSGVFQNEIIYSLSDWQKILPELSK